MAGIEELLHKTTSGHYQAYCRATRMVNHAAPLLERLERFSQNGPKARTMENAFHENRETIRIAPPIAIASSRRAIGRSFPPIAFTSRVRNS